MPFFILLFLYVYFDCNRRKLDKTLDISTRGGTSLEAIAEGVYNQLNLRPSDHVRIELEDIIDAAKDIYMGVWWEFLMAEKRDEELSTDGDTVVKKIEVSDKDSSANLGSVEIMKMAKDAGLRKVVPITSKGACVCMVKTTAELACMPNEVNVGFRYYRVGNDIYFPDKLPQNTQSIEVYFYGIDNDNPQPINRQYAAMVRQRLQAMYLPTAGQKVDETSNENANV